MNVKELRIGNYVIDNLEICQVIQIESNGNVMTTCKSKFPISNIQDLEPIPLNIGLLIRLGFSGMYEKYQYPLAKGWVEIDLGNSESDEELNDQLIVTFNNEYRISDVALDYVHQLQNIYFALSGKELEVESLKTLFPET